MERGRRTAMVGVGDVVAGGALVVSFAASRHRPCSGRGPRPNESARSGGR
jgi:hypothetical protein